MIWTPHGWLNKGYSFYMAPVLLIDEQHGLRIKEHYRNQLNKSKLLLYFCFNTPFKWLYTSNKMECFSCKSGCGGCMCIEVLKGRAGLGYKYLKQ